MDLNNFTHTFFDNLYKTQRMVYKEVENLEKEEELTCVHCEGTGVFVTANGPDDFNEEKCVCQYND